MILCSIYFAFSDFFHSVWKESEVSQSCLTLSDPMDCSLSGFSVHRIFQARILEWVAISFSRRSSWPRDWTRVSHVVGRRFTVWATREVSRYVHIYANGIISFHFMAELYFIMYMYHIIFIHSYVDGRLGWLNVLDIVNSAAMNTGEHVSFPIMFFTGYMPRSEIAGSYNIIFSFIRISILFCILATPIYIPTNIHFPLHPP